MKYCSKCGSELAEGVKFCQKCGHQIGGAEPNINNNVNYNQANMGIQRRELAMSIILSLVTCGIYGIYWFIVLTDDINKVSNDYKTSGGMAFLYSLLTCGIYTFIWNYKNGKKLNEAGIRYGKNISDNSILYLVLSLFGFGIISYALMQNDLNQFANN